MSSSVPAATPTQAPEEAGLGHNMITMLWNGETLLSLAENRQVAAAVPTPSFMLDQDEAVEMSEIFVKELLTPHFLPRLLSNVRLTPLVGERDIVMLLGRLVGNGGDIGDVEYTMAEGIITSSVKGMLKQLEYVQFEGDLYDKYLGCLWAYGAVAAAHANMTANQLAEDPAIRAEYWRAVYTREGWLTIRAIEPIAVDRSNLDEGQLAVFAELDAYQAHLMEAYVARADEIWGEPQDVVDH